MLVKVPDEFRVFYFDEIIYLSFYKKFDRIYYVVVIVNFGGGYKLIVKSSIKVRYAETDKMGIVHHSNYPIWFEVGRTEFIKKLGMPYSRMEMEGIMIPLIRLDVRYKGMSRYEDELIVETYIKELEKSRVTFGYNVKLAENDTLLTTGETEHVFTNIDLKPINLKKAFPNIYDLIENGYEK